MALTINTNQAASTASYYLSKNNAALQQSLTRLSSGSRINKPSDDAGGLAVSMKLNASISRLKGVNNNIQNAVSFLEVQDGVLQGAAGIITRMGELKALSQDVLKNSSDIANYNAEFKNLQVQLYQISQETFNGVSLFATTTTATGGVSTIFGGTDQEDNTVGIYTTERVIGTPNTMSFTLFFISLHYKPDAVRVKVKCSTFVLKPLWFLFLQLCSPVMQSQQKDGWSVLCALEKCIRRIICPLGFIFTSDKTIFWDNSAFY